MASIKGENTKPEKMVRSLLWKKGFRFQLHRKDLPGRPDIVLPKYKTVIFIHGCFWHRHGCSLTYMPKSNTAFWERKFAENQKHDMMIIGRLEEKGWKVITIWECEIRKNAEKTVEDKIQLIKTINIQ